MNAPVAAPPAPTAANPAETLRQILPHDPANPARTALQRGAADTARRLHVPILGMTCATCAGRVERALNALPGAAPTVNLADEQADLSFDASVTATAQLAEAVEAAGYDIRPDRRELAISGMTCTTCAGRVERALAAVPGVRRAEVNLATQHATVEGLGGLLRPAALVEAVQDAGYDAPLLTGDAAP